MRASATSKGTRGFCGAGCALMATGQTSARRIERKREVCMTPMYTSPVAPASAHRNKRSALLVCLDLATSAVKRGSSLQERARLCERKPRKPRKQCAWITISKIAEEIRLHVPFSEELLIAAEAGLPGREECLVDLGMVETGHRSAIETERPRGENQVGALQAGVPLRRRLHHVGVVLKVLCHPGVVRKQLRQLLIEFQVVRNDRSHGSGHRLLHVERSKRRLEPLLGFLRSDKHESRWCGIRARWRPLHQFVETPYCLIRNGPRLPLSVCACFAEEYVQRPVIDCLAHAATSRKKRFSCTSPARLLVGGRVAHGWRNPRTYQSHCLHELRLS